MIGFRSSVQGVRPILFPSLVPRIGIFCITHRCWPVLWPAGSIRSSSPSGWYENCFKPMALQVPGSPLRPCGTASGFSGSCGSTWIQDLCIFFWGVHCNVNFGMVEFAALTVWLHGMRCQSFRTSIDQMTGLHCNSPGKYDRDCGFAEGPWYSIGDSWRKGGCQSTERHPANVCQKCCYRLVSLWFWWAATQAWKTFETSWEYFTFMFAWVAAQIDPESTAGHAICDNSLGRHQTCLHNMRKLPYDHLVLAILTCNYIQYNCTRVDPPGASPPVSWLGPCVGCLSSRQLSPSPDLTWTNEAFPASQNKMLPFKWLEGSFKLKAFPAPSLPTYGSASGFSQCFSFAAITTTVWLNWMRGQSFRTSIDQLTGSHSNSPGKYNRDHGFPKDSWSSTGDSWRKKDCESMESHPAKICQIGCYRRVLLGRCVHSGQDLQTGQIWLQGHSCWKLAWFLRICASFWGVYCSVNFGMVEFAATTITVWLHWMRCQSFRTSLDKMTESHSNSSGKYGGYRSSVRRQLERLLQENQIQYPTKATWLLQTFIALILMGCDTSMVDIWNILRVCPFHVCMGSSTNWPRVNCWSCNLR